MPNEDEFLADMQSVNQQEDEDAASAEQDYYFEELVTFMQSLPKKAIFENYK